MDDCHLSKAEFELASAHNQLFRVFTISVKFVIFRDSRYVLLKVDDLTEDIEVSLDRLRRHCQMTLTNALCHERITPIHKMLALSTQIAQVSSTL